MILAMVSMLIGCNTAEGQEDVGGDASSLQWVEVTAPCSDSDTEIDLGVDPILFQVVSCYEGECADLSWGPITEAGVITAHDCGTTREIRVRYLY